MSLSLRNPFKAKKEYSTLDSIKSLSPQEIIRLEPKSVSSKIEQDGNIRDLSKLQREALYALLAIKDYEKKNGPKGREQAVQDFLRRKGLDAEYEKEIGSIMGEAAGQLYDEQFKRAKEKHDADAVQADLERRLAALRMGGRKSRKQRKQKRRQTRKSRKIRK